MKVAVLGTGIMGAPIARRLAEAGHEVRVWNRTRARAEPLAAAGADVADTPPDAVAGADVVLTMLADAAAIEATVTPSVLERADRGAVWLQMATVGVAATARFAALAAEQGLEYVDAPVMGSKPDAEAGRLLPLAAGPASARARCDEVFSAVAERVMWVADEPGAGSALKLVMNAWILCLVASLGECFALAEAFGVDPALMLEALRGRPFDTPYAHLKGEKVLNRDLSPAFALALGRKDLGLIAEAADGKIELPVVNATTREFDRAIELGHGDEDIAAVYFAVASR